MAGLQGSGKTTNSAKLARWFKSQGRHPLLVGADLQRPAAVEQLRTLGRQIEVPVFSEATDPVAVAAAGLAEARKTGRDVVIVDTAGRLAIDAELMDEVRRISEAVDPNYTFLVIDAMTGQDAVSTAEAFHQTLELDGVILTKLDGDARGGAALSVKEVVGRPIAFASTGEKLERLRPVPPRPPRRSDPGHGRHAHPHREGRGGLREGPGRGRRRPPDGGAVHLRRLPRPDAAAQEDGPAVGGARDDARACPRRSATREIDDKEIGRVEAIIRSMTTAERVDPDLIDQSRRVRIAKGSGTEPAQVQALVSQFKEMSKMMKRMGGMGSKRIAKSRRKAAKGKGKGPGGRTTGGGRVSAKGPKAPLRLPNLEQGLTGKGGLPNLGNKGLPDLSDLGLGEGFPER